MSMSELDKRLSVEHETIYNSATMKLLIKEKYKKIILNNKTVMSSQFDSNHLVNYTNKATNIKCNDTGTNIQIIPPHDDILYGIEITGYLNDDELLETRIDSFELIIGGSRITYIYLQNNICDIVRRKNFYSVTVNFAKLFYNTDFLPISMLLYHEVKLIVKGNNLQDSICYLHTGGISHRVLCDYHGIGLNGDVRITYKEFFKYTGVMKNNNINYSFPDEDYNILPETNMLQSIYFKFDTNIQDILDAIYIYMQNYHQQLNGVQI